MALVQRPLFLTSLMTSILCVRTPYLITKGESVVVTITTGPSYEKETVLVWKIMSIWDRNLYQEKCKTDQNYFAQNPGWIFYYSKRNIRDQPLCNVTHLRFLKYPFLFYLYIYTLVIHTDMYVCADIYFFYLSA